MSTFDICQTLLAEDDQAPLVVIFNHSRPRTRAPVFVCLPAMGVAASFYTPFAEALAQATMGVAVLTDLRGQGHSEAIARSGARFGYQEIVAQDIPSLIAAIAAQFPGRPIYLVGHSLGGQLGSLAAVHTAPGLAGLILVASGTAHYRVWPKALRWRAGMAVRTVRMVAALLPWYPGRLIGFGGDQPRRLMADWSYNASTGRYRCAGSRIDYEEALNDIVLPVLSVDPCRSRGADGRDDRTACKARVLPDRAPTDRRRHGRCAVVASLFLGEESGRSGRRDRRLGVPAVAPSQRRMPLSRRRMSREVPAGIALRVLGPVRLEHESGTFEPGARREQALLALLAAEARPMSRGRIAAMLWPEQACVDAATPCPTGVRKRSGHSRVLDVHGVSTFEWACWHCPRIEDRLTPHGYGLTIDGSRS